MKTDGRHVELWCYRPLGPLPLSIRYYLIIHTTDNNLYLFGHHFGPIRGPCVMRKKYVAAHFWYFFDMKTAEKEKDGVAVYCLLLLVVLVLLL